MEEKYNDLLESFSYLDYEDKQDEIINELKEMLDYFNTRNIEHFGINDLLKPLEEYEDDDEFLDVVFSYIMSLKKEKNLYFNDKEGRN